MLDLKLAARRLLKTPSFTITALVTLALCIGANLTIFAVVDSIVLRPLPFNEPDQLVSVFNTYPLSGNDRAGSSIADYYAYRDNIKAFSSIAIVQNRHAVTDQSGVPLRVERNRVSSEFFETLGVAPFMGRSFTDDEMEPANSHVVVLSHDYWFNQFNADSSVLGSSFTVDGTPVTVIGVLPEGFRYLSSRASLYTPAASDPAARLSSERHNNNVFEMVGRLARGETSASAQAEVELFNRAQLKDHPFAETITSSGFAARVVGLHAEHVQSVKVPLLILQGGVLFLLLIGVLNLVNLLLIRASGRIKDLAVRQALGASPRHIIVQVATETLLLSVLGGLFGLIAGAGGIRLLGVLGMDRLPMGAHVVFDGRVAVAAVIAAITLGLMMSIPIAWFNLRLRLTNALQAEARGGTGSHAAQRTRHAFIVLQIAVAFTLISSTGLLALSLRRVLETPPGFDPGQVLSSRLVLPEHWNNAERLRFIGELLRNVEALPAVSFAAINTDTPFTGGRSASTHTVEGFSEEVSRVHHRHYVAGDYWQAMGIPLIEGRFLEEADQTYDQLVCVIDQDVAQQYWADESPLGRRICAYGSWDETQAFTVVGVVGAAKQNDLSEAEPLGTVYFPYIMYPQAGFHLTVRAEVSIAGVVPMLRETSRQLAPDLPLDDLKPMQARIDDSLTVRSSPALLLGITSGVALLLASIGTYGVLAYAVSHRRREIGVSMALGATPERIGYEFFRIGMRALIAGVLVGVLGASLTGQAIRSVLFEVEPIHLPTLVGTALIMTVVTLLACLLPSLRASRVTPLEALRND